jgi:peptidoglycan/xylan/chitin deacetylase (PgdA/CDA1 family)
MSRQRGVLLLFWDYDTQWGADRTRGSAERASWGSLEFDGTDRVLELLAEHDIRACFAVVGAAARPGRRPYADPQQIRRMHALGHEVASHSLRHEWLPGLPPSALTRTLRDSKDALEQCIGASVATFVPPYNQPFDYPARGAFSLSERLHGGAHRVGIPRLCRALSDTGYRFCRIAYQPLPLRITERLLRRSVDRPGRLRTIAGVMCARLNTPGGFDAPALAMMERCSSEGGTAVVYGHPHSLGRNNAQHERWLAPFLQRAAVLRAEGRLDIELPRRLLSV